MLRTVLAALLRPLDRLLAAVMGSGFGVKDLFTLVNLLGGVASIAFAIQGNLWWASFIIMLGYLGDVVDGPVARLTDRGNRFGHELDNIADHTAQCVAPAFVVFLAFRSYSIPLAFGLTALLIVAGSIRHARGAAAKLKYDLAWHGMPRPVAAFITISFLNSTIFSQVPGGRWVAVALVLLVAVLNLVPLPFMSHHGRRIQWWGKLVIAFFFVSGAVASLWLQRYFWDLIFVYVTLYAGFSWIAMSAEERRDFYVASPAWRRELAGDLPEERDASTPGSAP
ncbi:MAG: CDP-alcohol phosphatidyltransferase family protein [Gammaproteobacteria bacterium]|nr:CDP-alcohol phosphatidyltransferase family protein [Gammaproteobacteria bacterium]